MKAKVIEDRCIGCGQCEAICDSVFQIGDEGIATVIVNEISDELIDDVKMAASGCPTDAIEVNEINDGLVDDVKTTTNNCPTDAVEVNGTN